MGKSIWTLSLFLPFQLSPKLTLGLRMPPGLEAPRLATPLNRDSTMFTTSTNIYRSSTSENNFLTHHNLGPTQISTQFHTNTNPTPQKLEINSVLHCYTRVIIGNIITVRTVESRKVIRELKMQEGNVEAKWFHDNSNKHAGLVVSRRGWFSFVRPHWRPRAGNTLPWNANEMSAVVSTTFPFDIW